MKEKIIEKINKLMQDENKIENIEIYTIEQIKENYKKIPDDNGVYFICNLEEMPINVTMDANNLRTEYNGKSLLYDVEKLIEKYSKGDKTILYIGKAEGKNGLRKRLIDYIEYGYGRAKSHRGGRAIWQISNNKKLGLCWIKVDKANKLETQMITKYKDLYGTFPMANWRR